MTRLQVRRGTAAAWTAANTLLSSGEFGYEIDTKKLKIGDGDTAWTSLPYFETSTLSGSTIVSLINNSAGIIDDDNIASTVSRTSHVHGNITAAGAIGSTALLPIITTTNGVLTAGSFGSAYGTFCQGNDSRLSNARTPTSHTHGNITNTGYLGSIANIPLITGTSGIITSGSFGTEANTFCVGNDIRLSDARTPLSHVHGNITNAGAIGSTASLPIITTTNGVLTTGTFGSSSGSFCQGNDSRLSDARAPTSHNNSYHSETYITAAGVTYEQLNTNGDVGAISGTLCAGNDSRILASSTATSSVTGIDLRSIPGNYYVVNSFTAGSMSTAAITANYMVYVPLIVGNKDLHISAFALNIQTGASGNFVVGIYSNDDEYNSQSGFCPNTLLTYSTEASTSSTGVIDSACDYTFTKNKIYWIGWMSSGTPTCYYKTQAYLTYLGQLPATPASSQTCWRHSKTYSSTPSGVGTLVAHDTAGFLHYKVYASA